MGSEQLIPISCICTGLQRVICALKIWLGLKNRLFGHCMTCGLLPVDVIMIADVVNIFKNAAFVQCLDLAKRTISAEKSFRAKIVFI